MVRMLHEPRFHDANFSQKAWLYRVVRNACFNWRRDIRRRGEILTTMPHVSHLDVDPTDDIAAAEAGVNLGRGLEQIIPIYQEVLRLRYTAGLSCSEIASTLTIPIGTVMSRLHRAHAALRKALST